MIKKIGLVLLVLIAVLALLLLINPQLQPNHDTPYLALQGEVEAPAPAESEVLQRILLYGDAGESALYPWQASLQCVAERASIAPGKTAVVALGDNIYYTGYPRLEEGQRAFDEDQLEKVSRLDAQLEIARRSGAQLFILPGNHDWLATELDSQAEHVIRYGIEHDTQVHFVPWKKGAEPLPEVVERSGTSLVFLDSEWLLHAEDQHFDAALQRLDSELAGIRTQSPEQLIVVTAHHPLETMGQHAGYLTDFRCWFFIKLIYAIFDVDQDVDHPSYQRMIVALRQVLARYPRVIYAAGHEHSLQVFGDAAGESPAYSLVSGAGNSSKISGVWHNDNSRFALSQEGFMELNITDAGVYLSVYDIHHVQAVAGFWLKL
jgi:hypothetical protein